MVWIGLVRPIAGYLLLAPCGPVWSKFSASEITLPFFTSCAAAMMSAGLVKLSVPISSCAPHLPQFLYFAAASRRSSRVSLRPFMALHYKKVSRIAYQAAALAAMLGFAAYLVFNVLANLQARNIASGFAFLGREAGFEIGESAFLAYSAADSYLRALAVGLWNTARVALAGIVLATVLGAAIGLGRLSNNLLLKSLSAAYVEFLRNVPLLVQLFFWYAVIAEALPPAREALQPLPGVFLSSRGFFIPVPHFMSGGMTWDTPVLNGFN